MGRKANQRSRTRATLGALLAALLLLALASTAQATPFHARTPSLDVTGLNHACGSATDSKGDLYLASAGESKVKVYNPSHVLLTEISDANTPCGLAVTTTGDLYVSEKAKGEVVRFKPNAYPFSGTPTYSPREEIDKSGKAKGIAVDRFDNRLYVAEGTKVAVYTSTGSFEANIGEGTLTEASGVASFSSRSFPGGNEKVDHYLWVADAKGVLADRLYLFGGTEAKALALRRELTGSATPDGSFGFGAAGAYLAADPGNLTSKFLSGTEVLGGECKALGEQACTAGHLFLYDATHKALDEFDLTGEYLDQAHNAAFADAEPTQVAIDRSGGTGDGTIYVTAGKEAGAKALAFGPLKAPSRKALKKPSDEAGGLSQELANAVAVATDFNGDVYAAAGSAIRVYDHKGKELTKFADSGSPNDLAVDSACNVYALDQHNFPAEAEVTYYKPSSCPPSATTTYSLEATVALPEEFPKKSPLLKAIAVDPCPGPNKDHLFVASGKVVHEYDSAENGSGLLKEEFSSGITSASSTFSIAVDCVRRIVYFGSNPSLVFAVSEETGEILRRFENTGPASAKVGAEPVLGVNQADGHVIEYDGKTAGAREYDGAGSFVAEFGSFTEAPRGVRVAVDSACSIHEPPLSGAACESFDPANGTAYVAYDDPSATHPPYDVNAFGLLKYSEPVKRKLTVKKEGSGSGTVKGGSIAEPATIDCGSTCSHEYLETEVVTLTAKADAENEFKGWGEGDCEAETATATEGTCEVTMNEVRTVRAKFETTKPKKVLKVVIKGSGKVTGPVINCPGVCEEEVGKDNKVTLNTEANPGAEFVKWKGGDCEGITATTCTVTMNQDEEVTAEFGVEHPRLTVTPKGSGTGTVTSEDGFIECPSTCSHKYDLNDEVVLEAKADPGSKFAGWTGCDAESEPEPGEVDCEVTMDEPREVTATFGALPQAKADQAHPVLYDEATLRGEVDPSGLETKYLFKYLSEEEYEGNGKTFDGARETPEVTLAPGEGFVAVEAPVLGLEEGTAYRFLLQAMHTVGHAVEAEDEGTFETLQRRAPQSCPNAQYRFGLSANLPDCRAYELATPAQTNGLTPEATGSGTSPSRSFSNWLTVQRGGAAGERLSYFTEGTLPGFEGNGVLDGYRAERGAGDHPAGGWQSTLFSPSYAESPSGLHAASVQLGIAPDQLYSGWEINHEPETLLGTLDDGVYLSTPAKFEPFEPFGQGSLGEKEKDLGALSRYVSAGGAHVIFTSEEHLEEGAAPKGTNAIYDRAVGDASAEVVSVKPGGTAFGSGEGAAYIAANEAGSAVVFSVGGTLYLHRAGGSTEITAGSNTFAGISEDGTRVFYAGTSNGATAASLFVCDTEAGPCAGTGSHAPTKLVSAGIFALVSPDGSHAFFSSTEALPGSGENEENNGEEAKPGAHNLYAWDGSTTRFVGQLTASDLQEFAGRPEMNLAAWTKAISTTSSSGRADAPTRSTPDGGAFVFQSHAGLTAAYDNEEVGEIYRYEPSAPAGERLVCVSCDPSGAPPTVDALLEDGGDASPLEPTTMIANLTENGQEVFFQSFDPLLPEDANESEDVYEWKADGVEGPGGDVCTRPGGCLALISSGQGEKASFLYAMSADGRDVFLQTKEKLVGADAVGSPSIYDAREGGGIPEPFVPSPCQGDDCQGNGTPPPGIPAAATTGQGEAPVGSSGAAPCAKGKRRVKGHCVATGKHKRKKHAKHHRRAHANRGGKR